MISKIGAKLLEREKKIREKLKFFIFGLLFLSAPKKMFNFAQTKNVHL
jgi:hypothetical protein